MNRLTVGSSRRKNMAENGSETISRAAEIIMTAGVGAAAAVLIACMIPGASAFESYKASDMTDAVYAMSTAVEVEKDAREELAMPDKNTSAAGEESVFEIIGEFFASMIFGER